MIFGLDFALRVGKLKEYDCLGCHSVEKKVVGSAWRDVTKKYKGEAAAKNWLKR